MPSPVPTPTRTVRPYSYVRLLSLYILGTVIPLVFAYPILYLVDLESLFGVTILITVIAAGFTSFIFLETAWRDCILIAQVVVAARLDTDPYKVAKRLPSLYFMGSFIGAVHLLAALAVGLVALGGEATIICHETPVFGAPLCLPNVEPSPEAIQRWAS